MQRNYSTLESTIDKLSGDGPFGLTDSFTGDGTWDGSGSKLMNRKKVIIPLYYNYAVITFFWFFIQVATLYIPTVHLITIFFYDGHGKHTDGKLYYTIM
jgi:hypothetical protein